MDVHTKNPFPLTVINGETSYVEIEALPEDVLLVASYEAVAQGLDIRRSGENQVAIENIHSVVRKIPANFLVARAYKLTPYKPPADRKKIA